MVAFFLLHHHLVPTLLTDIGPVETDTLPNPLRWIINHVLPRLVSNADREELTMTALGAGTAFSILHTLRCLPKCTGSLQRTCVRGAAWLMRTVALSTPGECARSFVILLQT